MLAQLMNSQLYQCSARIALFLEQWGIRKSANSLPFHNNNFEDIKLYAKLFMALPLHSTNMHLGRLHKRLKFFKGKFPRRIALHILFVRSCLVSSSSAIAFLPGEVRKTDPFSRRKSHHHNVPEIHKKRNRRCTQTPVGKVFSGALALPISAEMATAQTHP